MRNKYKKLSNKTALVTGTNGGIGQYIVRKFIEEGANVICCARKESDDFNNFIASLPNTEDQYVESVFFDLRDDAQVKDQLNKLIRKKIVLDILVNNAAIAGGSSVEMTSLNNLRDMFEVNFFSQISITTRLLRLLKKSSNGRIINIGSIAGLLADRGTLSYGSSKSALIFATKVMANEFADYNITVNAIAPAVVSTGMASMMDEGSRNDMTNSSFLKCEITPDEIANVITFLASDEANFITGQILRLDGGMKF